MRSVSEWVGKTDDAQPSEAAQLRILRRQGCRCRDCTRLFDGKLKPEFHHDKPLWAGGRNAERNLVALCEECHARITHTETPQRAKADRCAKRHLLKKKPGKFRRVLPGCKSSPWKHKANGQWVRR